MRKVFNILIALLICCGLWVFCDFTMPNHYGPNLLTDVIGYENTEKLFTIGIHDNLNPEKVTDRTYSVKFILNEGKYSEDCLSFKLRGDNGFVVVNSEGAVENESATFEQGSEFSPNKDGFIILNGLKSYDYEFYRVDRTTIRPIVSPKIDISFKDNYISQSAGTIEQTFIVNINNIFEGIRFDSSKPLPMIIAWCVMLIVLFIFTLPGGKKKKEIPCVDGELVNGFNNSEKDSVESDNDVK